MCNDGPLIIASNEGGFDGHPRPIINILDERGGGHQNPDPKKVKHQLY